MAYLGGAWCDAPLWPDHENFLPATLYEKLRFSPFSSKFQKKWANLQLSLNVQKQKVFQLQWGFAPLTPDQGLCPWTPLGALPPDPRYRLALCALAMAPPLPNPKYATAPFSPVVTRGRWGVIVVYLFFFFGICSNFNKLKTPDQ